MIRVVSTFVMGFGLLALSCRGDEGPAGPAGRDAIDLLTDPSIQPKIIFTSPPPNSMGPYEDFTYQLAVRFNKIMDRSSLRRSIRLSTPAGNLFVDTSSVRSLGGDIFSLNAVDSAGRTYGTNPRWEIARVCTLAVSTGAADINGNHPGSAYSMTFEPEPFFRVKQVYPANGAANLSQFTNVVLTFNSPVDSSVIPSLSIAPPVAGGWHPLYGGDSTTVSFSPDSVFATGTIYTISVEMTARDVFLDSLRNRFSSTFSTAQ